MTTIEPEEWTDSDGNPFTVHKVTEEHTAYVDGAPRDLKKNDRVIDAGSAGYHSFDPKLYKAEHGAKPPTSATRSTPSKSSGSA